MKKFFYFLLFLISIPFIITMIINIGYNKKIKKTIIKQINYSEENDINIGEIKFSLIKKFPNATIVINNINSKQDENINIDKIHLTIDPYKLIEKIIYIKNVTILNSKIELSSIKKIIQKENTKTINHEALNIKNIFFNNCYILNTTKDSSVDLKVFIPEMKVTGEKKEKDFNFKSIGVFEIQSFTYKSNMYNIKEKMHLDALFTINNNIKIKKCEINNSDNNIINVKYNEDKKIIINADNISYTWLNSLLPEHVYNKTKKLNLKGNIDIYYFNEILSLKSNNTSLEYNNYIIDSVSYKMDYKDTTLMVKSFDFVLFEDIISGDFILNNITKNPKINLNINSTIKSNNINNIFPDLDVLFLDGKTYINGKYIGHIGVKNSLLNDFVQGYKKIDINQYATILKPNENFQLINNFFVKSQLIKNKFYVNSSSFNIKNSDFKIIGILEDISLLFNKKNYTFNCDLISNDFKLKDFIVNNDKNNIESLIPKRGILNINTNIEKFNFEKFFARQVKGRISIKNEIIYGNEFNFESCDGNVISNFTLENGKNKYIFTTNSSIKNINIKNMFYQLNNFNQKNIKHNNINGSLNSDFYLRQEWDYKLNGNYDKFYAFCDITIEKGELNDYAPLLALSNYIEIEELKNINFSKLENQIEIKKRKIKIPFMEIKSSAIDIAGTGTHFFNNDIKYEFKLFLNDILSKDIQDNQKINEEFGYIEYKENIGTVLYLKMTGNAKDPKITYEGIKLKDQLSNSSKKSKKEIKNIFQKKIITDSIDNKNIDYNLILEWDEK